ncbi:AcrB/AcrD/AcrF family protein [Pseudoalteromonas citrea]|uniref:AcrB/AcrD/AcrF family protein n=1 Tax=Pseudoalteromonas citrea TaxID=43655 RepID=A0A5S3XPN6_9GAMM|nr:efflux RND transporter permease subunit [Pseudoalteromonas citrea]TMP40994.1 AcrB/AcrD/AcrF family protein [Pseudoalteromonas citrea]TMP58125.1 AcrB/AcrD/AcrF family protein [Pseudoalteromonas citrea]
MERTNTHKGLIGFFIYNPVAANLLMLFVVVLGTFTYQSLHKQIFPSMEVNTIDIKVTHFGSSAKEIEERVINKIEDSLKSLSAIKRARSWSSDNTGLITLELHKSANPESALDKVKLAIDATPSFPGDLEPIIIQLNESLQPAVRLALITSNDHQSLKAHGLGIYNELLNLQNVTVVKHNIPQTEIAVEVDPLALKMYQVTVDDIRSALSQFSDNLSVGSVRSDSGVIPLRIENQAYDAVSFSQMPILTFDSGLQVLLKDIATVKENYVEGLHMFSFSGQEAAAFEVLATSSEDAVIVADSVQQYVNYKNKHLPQDMQLKVIIDGTNYLDQRLGMMESNLLQGALLVLLILSLFLSIKLAFWVVVGLPVCFLGAILMMPVFDVSINLISLFAFIMVLGLIVDDAIVVGESVHTETTRSGHTPDAVYKGVKKVMKPAVFGVLTTIAVFFPFIFSDGAQSELFKGISVIVIFCLVFSLIESKFILPAHLANMTVKAEPVSGFKYRLNNALNGFSRGPLSNAVEWSIHHKWSMLLLFLGMWVLSLMMVQFGHVKSIPDPMVPIDQPEILIELNDNASVDTVKRAAKTFEAMLKAQEQETINAFGHGMIKDILIESVGQTDVRFTVLLVDEEHRPFSTFALSKRWRDNMPNIIALKAIHIKDDVLGRNNQYGDFGYFLYSDEIEDLNAAATYLASALKKQPGVYEVGSTMSAGRKELLMELKPLATKLDLSLTDIARQVQQTHMGAEADRFSLHGEEVRVMVRYPLANRASVSELQYVRITLTSGEQVFLGDVVNFIETDAVTTIRREAGKRSLYVFASIDQDEISESTVVEKVDSELLPIIKTKYPSISTELGGKIKETSKDQSQMLLFTIASLLAVYILLAMPLKSYFQPLLIMSVIPFCMVGSIWGHWVFSEDFSLVSIFGLIAAMGVVVNDSLILVDRINEKVRQSHPIVDSIRASISERFRAILLTSLTTFFGLLPIMFETSLQAKFVSPMAVSLGFAVLVSTCVTLFLVPILYVIGHNFSARMTQCSTWLNRKKRMTAVSES